MSALAEELEACRAQYGTLNATNLVDFAADPTRPCHDWFDWDDTVAGPKWRLVQAGERIRSYRVRYVDRKGGLNSVRGYVSVPADAAADSSREYLPTTDALADDFTRTLLLHQLERDIAALKSKYGALTEFAAIVRKAIA